MELEQRLQVSFECQDKLSVRRFIVHAEILELFRMEILANSTDDDPVCVAITP